MKPTTRHYRIVNATHTGKEWLIYAGQTTRALAIARARMYADATTGPLDIAIYSGLPNGRKTYRLTREG